MYIFLLAIPSWSHCCRLYSTRYCLLHTSLGKARGPADRAHHAACRPRSSADQSAWPNSPCPSPPPPSHPPCRPSTKKHGTDLPRLTSLIFSQGTGSTLVHIPSHTILPPPPPPPAGEDIHFVRPGGCHLIIRHLAHSSGFISRRV